MKSDNKIVVDEIVELTKYTGYYRRGSVYLERGWWCIDCVTPELRVRARVDAYGPEPRYQVGDIYNVVVELSQCDAMMRRSGYTPSDAWSDMLRRREQEFQKWHSHGK